MSKSSLLDRLKTRLLVSGWLAGLAAGLWGAAYASDAPTGEELFLGGLQGFILVVVAAPVGGMIGGLIRNLFDRLSPPAPDADVSDDLVGGVLLGNFAGCFVGAVAWLIFGDWSALSYGAAIGAAAGGFLGALPGDFMVALFHLAAVDGEPEEAMSDELYLNDLPEPAPSKRLESKPDSETATDANAARRKPGRAARNGQAGQASRAQQNPSGQSRTAQAKSGHPRQSPRPAQAGQATQSGRSSKSSRRPQSVEASPSSPDAQPAAPSKKNTPRQ